MISIRTQQTGQHRLRFPQNNVLKILKGRNILKLRIAGIKADGNISHVCHSVKFLVYIFYHWCRKRHNFDFLVNCSFNLICDRGRKNKNDHICVSFTPLRELNADLTRKYVIIL